MSDAVTNYVFDITALGEAETRARNTAHSTGLSNPVLVDTADFKLLGVNRK